MPRNGSGVYSLPGGSTVTNGDTSDATDINTPLADIVSDLNTARPIVAGGTGATTASGARTNLGLGDAATKSVTGSDAAAVTGTAGTDGNLAQWNADGDAVDSSLATSSVATLTDTQTLTNKTLTSPTINVTSDATGDIYYRTAGGAFARLGIGSTDQVLTVASGLPSWADAATGAGTVQAWVNFNGTGAVAIRASGNVSSITDNGTGDYTVNFSSALTDASYAATTTRSGSAGSSYVASGSNSSAPTTSAYRVNIIYPGVGANDDSIVAADFIR